MIFSSPFQIHITRLFLLIFIQNTRKAFCIIVIRENNFPSDYLSFATERNDIPANAHSDLTLIAFFPAFLSDRDDIQEDTIIFS